MRSCGSSGSFSPLQLLSIGCRSARGPTVLVGAVLLGDRDLAARGAYDCGALVGAGPYERGAEGVGLLDTILHPIGTSTPF